MISGIKAFTGHFPQRGSKAERILTTLTTTGGIQLLGFISGALMANALGVENRGILAILILWPSILAYLGDCGGPVAYVVQAASGSHAISALIWNSFVLVAIQSAVICLVGAPIMHIVLRDHPDLYTLGLGFMLLFVPLNLQTRYLNSINQGIGRIGHFNATRLLVQLSYVVGILLLWTLGATSVTSVILVTLLSNGAALATASLGVWRFARGMPQFNPAIAKESMAFGLKSHIGTLAPVDSMRLDLAIITFTLSTRDAGLYAVALSVASIPRSYSSSFGMIAMPSITATTNRFEQTRLAAMFLRLSTMFAFTSSLVIALSATWLVPVVFGDEFSDATLVTQLLVWGLFLSAIRQVLADCLRGAGNPISGSAAEVASWVIVVPAMAALLPLAGLPGVAIAVGLSYAASLIVCYHLGQRTLSLRYQDWIPNTGDLRTIYQLFRHRDDGSQGSLATVDPEANQRNVGRQTKSSDSL